MIEKCSKCSGEMAEGLMLTPGAIIGVRWSNEKPNRWFNRLGNKPRIIAYSCKECGYLESYVEKK